MTAETPLFCANHPNTPATLRCNQCEKPICLRCAVHTPTGYRCRECVRAQQKIFNTSLPLDYLLAVLVCLPGALAGSFAVGLVSFIGFFGVILVPALATAAGATLAEITRRLTGKRRSKALFQTALLAFGLGALPGLALRAISGDIWGAAFQGLYLFFAASSLYYRLSGIQL